MGGWWRRAGALTCVCAGLLSAGCGDADDGGNGMPRGGLGEQRYERVAAVIDGTMALTDFAGPTEDLRTACEALDTGDALLAALRRSCAVTIKVVRRVDAVGSCGGGACPALGAAADAARQQVEAYEALAKAVDAAKLSGACADAVKAPDADVAYLEATAKAFDLLAKARSAGGDRKDGEQAGRLLTDAAEATADAPDALERIRQDCGGVTPADG